MKLKLKDITLLGIDCIDINRLKKSFDICMHYCEFADIKFLTSQDTSCLNIPAVKIDHIGSKEKYSKFMIKELNSYVETPFVLIIQWDGFICNPDAWTFEFLNYDYIGAPWDDLNIGNGGFSLRSKKLLEVLQASDINQYHPEDVAIGRLYKEFLISKGIKISSLELAKRFSHEYNFRSGYYWKNQFGFHVGHNQPICKLLENWKDYNLFFGG